MAINYNNSNDSLWFVTIVNSLLHYWLILYCQISYSSYILKWMSTVGLKPMAYSINQRGRVFENNRRH
jgi:hypothetical protein